LRSRRANGDTTPARGDRNGPSHDPRGREVRSQGRLHRREQGASTWGTQNEAFFEADWESAADIDAAFNAAMKDEAFKTATLAFAEHVVDGASVNYLLSEESIS
jgi:hypothetical protein